MQYLTVTTVYPLSSRLYHKSENSHPCGCHFRPWLELLGRCPFVFPHNQLPDDIISGFHRRFPVQAVCEIKQIISRSNTC